MKQTAELKLKKQSRSEKEVLITTDIPFKTSESTTFGTRVSAFVPKADSTKPMPKIAVTVSVGHDNIRLVADNTEDLWDYFARYARPRQRWFSHDCQCCRLYGFTQIFKLWPNQSGIN